MSYRTREEANHAASIYNKNKAIEKEYEAIKFDNTESEKITEFYYSKIEKVTGKVYKARELYKIFAESYISLVSEYDIAMSFFTQAYKVDSDVKEYIKSAYEGNENINLLIIEHDENF